MADSMQTIRRAADWIVANWATIAIAWSIVSAALSALWRAIPEPSRQRLAQRYPRVDAAARIVRKAGLDLIPVVLEGLRLLTGKRLPPLVSADDRPTDPPKPPATPSAGLLVIALLVLAGCGPHPWHVTAHAAINTQAHGLAVADAVLARAIADDPESNAEALRSRYESAVRSLRVSLEVLRAAEASVDAVADTQDTAEQCRAIRAVQEALGVVSRIAEVLRASGVAVPRELSNAASAVVSMAELATRVCLQGGVR